MDLILWRHASAEDPHGDGPAADAARALTKRGEREAAKVAAWLRARLPAEFTLLASPAVRTRQTAAALDAGYRVVESLAPGARPKDVLGAARWGEAGAPATVVVVGHQPTLGETAALVVSGRAGAWSVKKGGLWWISDRDREAGAPILVRAVLSPDLA